MTVLAAPGRAHDPGVHGAWLEVGARGGSPAVKAVRVLGKAYGSDEGPDNAVQQRLDDAAAEAARADGAARSGDHARARELYQSAHDMLQSTISMHMDSRPESSVVSRAGSDAVNDALAHTAGAAHYHAQAPVAERGEGGGELIADAQTNGGGPMTLDADCADCDQHGPEHFGPTGGSVSNAPWDGAASRFSDDQYRMATAACDAVKGAPSDPGNTVKARCFLPHHEPGGAVNRNGVHAAAQRVSSLSGHDAAAVSAAKGHLRSHYSSDLKEEAPDVLKASVAGEELVQMFGGLHGGFSGTHSHVHSPYGSQGGDSTHEHAHTHAGDNLHRHAHDHPSTAAAGRRPSLAPTFRTEGELTAAGRSSEEYRQLLAGRGRWAVLQEQAYWHVLAADGSLWSTVDSYTEAVEAIARQLAEGDGDTRPVLDQGWKSEMAFEGVSTGDGRFIEKGAIEYRNCPMPLMLQTETSRGHTGAVLAGAITKTGKLGQVALGAGDFDASDAGRQAQQILQARGTFGVSIDVAEAEGQPSCPDHGTDIDQCGLSCDWEIHFTLIRVMGLTMTPFPAFEDAYIELQPEAAATGQAALPTAASAAVEETLPGLGPVEPLPYDQGGVLPGGVTYVPAGATVTAGAFRPGFVSTATSAAATVEWTAQVQTPLAAAASSAVPPGEWFAPPKDWAGRLVRQPSGRSVCPLVVEEPDPAHGNLRRVYGHMADWFTCHTGIPNRCVTAPHSKTDYAAFNLRPLSTQEGNIVRVGHLTMGCGHADTDPRLAVADVRAHYDGGPGAVRMAHVRMGEDTYGPWVAGYVDPAASEDQVRSFASCSLSGDWRDVWGRGLECVACLAGVTVPGFPIAAAALAAAGVTVPLVPELGPTRIGWRNEAPVALVAAGIIRQPLPWERHLAALEARLAVLADENRRLEATVAPLRPMAAAALSSQMGLTGAAPTPQDVDVAACLQRLLQAAHDAMEAQLGDEDMEGEVDPDDAAVHAHLQDLMAVLDKAIVAQAADSDEDAQPEEEAPAQASGRLPGIGHLLSRNGS